MQFSLPASPRFRQAHSWWPLLSLLVLLSSLSFEARADHGIFEGTVKVGGNFYSLAGTAFGSYQSANLGSYTQGQALVLNGGELKTYKHNGDNITGATLFYVVYPQGARPTSPSFGTYNLPFALNLNASDQSWNTYGGSVDLLSGLTPGSYTLEVFGQSSVNYNGGGSGNDYLSNNGFNYTATFSVTAAPPAALPVELTAFEAARQGTDALLTWTTASEKNSQGFDVQVSTGGQEFRSLGFVAGAGSSSTAHQYRFVDADANKTGLRYYRLRQVDAGADGTATYSPVRAVGFAAEAPVLSAAPQPFGPELVLTLHAAQAQPGALVTLTDATGRRVLARSLDVPAGTSRLLLTELAAVPAGLYVLQVALAGQPVRLKVVKE